MRKAICDFAGFASRPRTTAASQGEPADHYKLLDARQAWETALADSGVFEGSPLVDLADGFIHLFDRRPGPGNRARRHFAGQADP